jgi:hypothetical protein
VDQAKINVKQTAAFARRVVCRTLTVVGGVAAGTALAWCLSTASASADVRQPLQPVEQQVQTVVTDVQDVTAPVTGPVEAAVGTAAQYLQDPPPPPKDPLKDLGDKVKDAAQKFRSDAESGLDRLPGNDFTDGGTHHEYPADGYGRSLLPTAPVPAPAAAAVAQVVDLDAIAHRTAKDRAFADGMSRRGSPEPVLPAFPGVPGVPAPIPFAPAGVPTTGGHGSAGNSADSHLIAALPWQDGVFGLTRGGVAAVSDAATFGRPGAQPGVAPD